MGKIFRNIKKGLLDAIAFAKGDKSKGILHHVILNNYPDSSESKNNVESLSASDITNNYASAIDRYNVINIEDLLIKILYTKELIHNIQLYHGYTNVEMAEYLNITLLEYKTLKSGERPMWSIPKKRMLNLDYMNNPFVQRKKPYELTK